MRAFTFLSLLALAAFTEAAGVENLAVATKVTFMPTEKTLRESYKEGKETESK